MNDETQKYVNKKEKEYGEITCKSFGSSLKICKVADGSAHCYPLFGPTMSGIKQQHRQLYKELDLRFLNLRII